MYSILLQASGQPSPYIMPLFLAAMFGVMYFFFIRPQNEQRKKQEEFMKNLKKNDKVVTSGGVHGVITEVDEANGTVKLLVDASKNVTVTVTRARLDYELTQFSYGPKESK